MALADRARKIAPPVDDEAAEPTPDAETGPGEPQGGSSSFKKPDVSQFVPPDLVDAYQRTVAAGMKLMYSPDMRDEMQAGIQSQEPIPKRIADNTTGLLLTLDGKTQGGFPAGALFPVGVQLAGECAEVLDNAGQAVSQEDFNDSLLAIYAMIGKKLGATDDQLMQSAQQSVGEPMTGDPATPPAPPQVNPAPPGGVPA
jgi:hypothetical protein